MWQCADTRCLGVSALSDSALSDSALSDSALSDSALSDSALSNSALGFQVAHNRQIRLSKGRGMVCISKVGDGIPGIVDRLGRETR